MSKVGDRIRVLRIKRGLSQSQLADIMGLKRSAIGNYELGIREPDLDTIEAFADFFDTSIADLMGREENQTASEKLRIIRDSLLSPFRTDEWKKLTNRIAKLSDEKKNMPDYSLAAIRATETLMKFRVSYAPISPLPILKATPGVIVISFTEIASISGLERSEVLGMVDAENRNAITFVKEVNGKLHYLVAYNMTSPFYVLQYSLACELGHIIMRHDGSKDDDVREAEVECFANYLLFPRQLIHAGSEVGIPQTVGNIGRAMGCYEQCLETVKDTPGVKIPKELNRIVKSQFEGYITNYIEIQNLFFSIDSSPIADLGTYMDNYEE